MKKAMIAVALVACLGIFHASAVVLHASRDSPVTKVVSLLEELKTKVEADGKAEQESYDKFACWCEDTLARKATDISDGKARIAELEQLIVKLGGEIGSLGAEIEQLKKDIAANIEAQKEATEVRDKEYGEYEEEKTESEQCIGALEAAIKVLTGAGTGKTGFLGTLQETQVLSVVEGVRGTLKNTLVARAVSDQDLEVVRHFVDRPEDFLGNRAGVMSAAQIAQNPFGDYAPQSGQIQGILKGMYDAFTGDLEKANAEESEKQKAFEALMETKQRELAALQATLTIQTKTKAEKAKTLADSKSELDDAKEQLKEDEKFFAETKENCASKATMFSQRTNLRTQELNGITKAIEILSSGKVAFEKSAESFLQVAKGTGSTKPRKEAFKRLSVVAIKFQNMGMAQIAAAVKTGGHFDKIIAMIDNMIELLRKEEADDIAHRDRCESSINQNENDMEDLEHSIKKADEALGRMNNTEDELKAKIDESEKAINKTETSMLELKEMRIEESEEFKSSLKDDADAVDLIEQAIVALAKFYKDNKIPLELAQKKEEPEYTVDPDVAPDTTFQTGDYGGRQSESEGIIAILEMIKEDIEGEMKVAREDDAQAQSEYQASMKTLKDSLQAQTATKIAAEKALAELQGKMLDKEEFKSQKEGDLDGQKDLEGTLEKDCDWLKEHFDSRREKRKAEMDGLVDAKNYLMGAEDDDEED